MRLRVGRVELSTVDLLKFGRQAFFGALLTQSPLRASPPLLLVHSSPSIERALRFYCNFLRVSHPHLPLHFFFFPSVALCLLRTTFNSMSLSALPNPNANSSSVRDVNEDTLAGTYNDNGDGVGDGVVNGVVPHSAIHSILIPRLSVYLKKIDSKEGASVGKNKN